MAGLFSSKKSKKEKEEKAAAAKNAAMAAASASTHPSNLGPLSTTTSGGNGSIASSTTMAPPPNSGGKQQLHQLQTNNNNVNNNNNTLNSPVTITTNTLSMTPAPSSTSSSVPVHLRENSSASLDYSSSSQQQQQQQQLNNKSSVDSDKRMYHHQQQQHQQHQLQQTSTHQQQQQQQLLSSNIGGGSNLVSASSISTHNSFAHLSSSNGPWISAQVMSTNPFPRFSHTASYVQTGTDIYVFGGVVKGSAQRDMHVIDSRKLSSSRLFCYSFLNGYTRTKTGGSTHAHSMAQEDPCLFVPIVPSITVSFFSVVIGGQEKKGKRKDDSTIVNRQRHNGHTHLDRKPSLETERDNRQRIDRPIEEVQAMTSSKQQRKKQAAQAIKEQDAGLANLTPSSIPYIHAC
jgi:hypothetical protein